MLGYRLCVFFYQIDEELLMTWIYRANNLVPTRLMTWIYEEVSEETTVEIAHAACRIAEPITIHNLPNSN